MALIDDAKMSIYGVTNIQSVISKEPEPPTEEEQLKQFIKDYIDEPPPKPEWKSLMAKIMAYTQACGGRRVGKSMIYKNLIKSHVIIDDYYTPHENPTFKPTKKQARLLKKFRRLKRFK